MDVFAQVLKTIETHKLINNDERILVGFSGGADSTVLLHILFTLREKYNITVGAAHINHQLRPTAERDMRFCENFCKARGIEFHCIKADIKGGAEKASMGEEEYARRVRYDYFTSLGYDKIATAHNKNDVCETILFHFIRGAASDGLSGIPYIRNNIVRPLLDIKKDDIFQYCKNNGLEYMTDETNLEPVYTRNKLRLELIPEIENNFNPAFIDTTTKNAALISDDAQFLQSYAENLYTGKLTADFLAEQHICIQRRLLQLHYKKASESCLNLPSKYIDAILNLVNSGKSGSMLMLPCGYEALIEYGELIIRKKSKKLSFCYRAEPEKVLKIPEIGKAVVIRKADSGICISDTNNLEIRNRRPGDFFYPVGMNGKKKLSDYFTDKKIPVTMRDKIPLLTENGHIISVIGMRNGKNPQKSHTGTYKIDIMEDENAE